MSHSTHSENTQYYYLALLQEDSGHEDQDLVLIDGKEYGIHGLWPEIDKKSYPQYCNTLLKFDVKMLEPIKSELNSLWHSNSRKNKNFWEHEWLKHGTCTNPTLMEFDYFSKAIDLYRLVRNMLENNAVESPDYFNKNNRTFLFPFDLSFNFMKNENHT